MSLANTLFLRDLQMRDYQKQRKAEEEKQFWDSAMQGLDRIEQMKNANFDRQVKLAETQGKLAAALGKERPQYENKAYDEMSQIGADLGMVDANQARVKREHEMGKVREKIAGDLQQEAMRGTYGLQREAERGTQNRLTEEEKAQVERELLGVKEEGLDSRQANQLRNNIDVANIYSRGRKDVANIYVGGRYDKDKSPFSNMFKAATALVKSETVVPQRREMYQKFIVDVARLADAEKRGQIVDQEQAFQLLKQRHPKVMGEMDDSTWNSLFGAGEPELVAPGGGMPAPAPGQMSPEETERAGILQKIRERRGR